MSYRLELTKDNRKAGCQDTLCKKKGIKILKGELRLGSWVEIAQYESASWRWRHWGCTSGSVLENIRNNLKQGDPNGEYQWEYMDGLEECPPDVQEKFKTAVINGKVADEDFNGDPEFNVLGQKGIRSRTSLKAATEAKENGEEDGEQAQPEAQPEAPKPQKKRGRAKKGDDDDGESEAKPAPKRTKKAKPEDNDEDEVIPAKKSRAKKPTKKEESGDEVAPAKKSRAKKTVKQDEDEDDETDEVVPKKKARSGKGIKKEEENDDEAVTEQKSRVKKAIKKEGVEEEAKPVKKLKGKKAVKKEESDDDAALASVEEERGIPVKEEAGAGVDVKPTKKSRAKKSSKALKNKKDKDVSNDVKMSDIPVIDEPETEEMVPGIGNELLRRHFDDAVANQGFEGDWEDYVKLMKEGPGPNKQNSKMAGKEKKTYVESGALVRPKNLKADFSQSSGRLQAKVDPEGFSNHVSMSSSSD
ncbi:MAG: serine/threonine-protein kinase M1 [Claussenomyces sp. TS43310]|nr:MAG: serine/threonine-protein kinase M1 [Claussenomyces sp. TS43310]